MGHVGRCQAIEAVPALGAGRQQIALDHARRCPLAVCAVMPAVIARSDAVVGTAVHEKESMAARAGSPIRAATSERAFTVIMAGLYAPAGQAATVNGSVAAEASMADSFGETAVNKCRQPVAFAFVYRRGA